MDRRYFHAITGVSLTALAHQWLLDPTRVAASVRGKRVGIQLVADIERVVDACRGMDDAIGGGGLIRALREDLRLVTELLSNSSYTEQLGARLHVAAAELARLTGYQSVKAGQNAAAQRYYAVALRSAHAADDRAVGANVLAFMAFHSISFGDPRGAVVMIDSALRGGGQFTPKVAAYLHSCRARAAACRGDDTAWDRSPGMSFDLLTHSRPNNEPAWLYWLDEAFLHGNAGAGALELACAYTCQQLTRFRADIAPHAFTAASSERAKVAPSSETRRSVMIRS